MMKAGRKERKEKKEGKKEIIRARLNKWTLSREPPVVTETSSFSLI